MNLHHKLLWEIGHLKDRERVLLSENDQLRAQLVEMKEQEKKKYDDLMVQYNMKREYEDDGLDRDGTSNNQVTVKTEWGEEELKVEIKEEDDDDNCGCDRFVVKKEEVSDDDDNSMQLNHPLNEVVQSNLNPPMDTSSRDQLHTPIHSVGAPSTNEPMQLTNSSVTEQSDQQVMAANDDQLTQSTRVVQSSDAQANMDRVMSHENGLAGEDEDYEDMGGVDELCNSANDNHDGAVVASNEPSTSARARSNRVTSKQSTASTARKLNKRKQSQPNRTDKRSKKTVEVNDGEDEDGEEDRGDIGNEAREESKIKILHLNCTQSNCNFKLDSMVNLNDHFRTVHQLSPLQCFATNCNARFDSPQQISAHNKQNHSRSTRFLCSVCSKEYGSQHKTYQHWNYYHLTGQFECNLVSDCGQVTDTRRRMETHQLTKHYSQSNHFHCTQPGCTASFSCNSRLKQHEQTHLATNQFHCNWPHCSKQFKQRGNLVVHIRMCHFGLPQSMKAQKEKNIVDLRDPNEYVRVVVDE